MLALNKPHGFLFGQCVLTRLSTSQDLKQQKFVIECEPSDLVCRHSPPGCSPRLSGQPHGERAAPIDATELG